MIGSVIARVKAIAPNLNTSLSYSFLNEGYQLNHVHEFEFRNSFTGEIVLRTRFNTKLSNVREVKYVI